jgi:tmRNA-binding protein
VEKIVCKNPDAHRDYFLEEKYEAGIELKGPKLSLSVREKPVSKKASA